MRAHSKLASYISGDFCLFCQTDVSVVKTNEILSVWLKCKGRGGEMEKNLKSNEETNIINVPVTLAGSSFQRVVISDETDTCLTSKEELCSHQNPEECNQDAEFDNDRVECEPAQSDIQDEIEQQNEGNCVISETDEVFKSSGQLPGAIESYEEIESTRLIPSVDSESTESSSIGRIVVQGENTRSQVLTNEPYGQLQKENGSIYSAIPTFITTPVSANSTTYVTFDSLQSLPAHVLLNAPDLSNGHIDTGAHYVINAPQIQGVNGMSQGGGSQVLLVQVPTSQNANQVIGTQASNTSIQTTVGVGPSSVQMTNARSVDGFEATKRPRAKGGSKGKAKRAKQDNHNTALRPIAPRVLAVPMSSPFVIAASPTTSQIYGSAPPLDQLQQLSALPSGQISRTTGQHFEVLGRCIVCFRFCRTTTYCRAEKRHTDVRAAACSECETKGYSTVVCRRKHQHKGQNAYPSNMVINTELQRAADLKEMCIKNLLPPCFSELHSLTVHHADCIFSQPRTKNENEEQQVGVDGVSSGEQASYRKPTDYARGYLYPYTKEIWEQWLTKFCLQTRTNYRIRTGKRVNKKSDHGLANHNGKIVVYRVLESQLHNCALGGRPRKKAIREGSKRRKSRGSKLIGCCAVIHTRLIVTEDNWKALEITVPKLSAHLPVHDPRMTNPEISGDVNSMVLTDTFYDSEQGLQTHTQDDYSIIEDVGFHNETEAEFSNDHVQFVNTMDIDHLRKQTKTLLSVCGNLLDDVSNLETLKNVHFNIHTLYNELLPVSVQKRSRKRDTDAASLIHTDEVLEEGESRSDSVRQSCSAGVVVNLC